MMDQHFADAGKRRELHAAVREARKQRAELDKDYEVAVGRMGALYLTCKNSECGAESKTQQQAREGQMIVCKPISVTCPFCANTYAYDGQDLKLKLITMN